MIHIGGGEFEQLLNKKVQEMKLADQTEDFIDEERLGGIKVFINLKPKMCLISLKFENSDIIYVGSDQWNFK